ncbi:MAG: sodium:solute symporter family protein [Proteobacteria bacterium]|nr:sodium:solute symporter family protein [Pseudomonadota bacterium]
MVSGILSQIIAQAEAIFAEYIGKMSAVDLLVIAIYMVICLFIGVKKAGSIRNIKEFALGDKQISTAVLVSTMYATYLGAGVTIGTIEAIGSMGLIFALAVLIGPIRWLIWGKLIGANIEQFRGCLSMGEIMYRLYGPEGRMITNVAYLMGTIATVAAQTTAIGHLLHYFLGMSIVEGVLLGIGTIIIYSMMGGVKSVVMTDTLQFSVVFVMIPVLCWFMIKQFGGWHEVAPLVPAAKWTISLDWTTVGAFFSLAAYTVIDGNDNTSIQRCLMARDSKQLRKAFRIVTAIDLCMVIMVIILGLLVSTRDPAQAPDLLWETMNCNLPPLVNGMMVVGLLAVIMSTADSFLNTAGVVMAHDIFKTFVPHASNKQEVFVARAATLIVGVLAAFLAVTGSGILQLVWLSANFYYTVVLVPIVAGFLYFRTNRRSFIVSLVFAVSGTLFGAWLQGSFGVISLIMGISCSALGLFSTHYWQLLQGTLANVAIYEKKALSANIAINDNSKMQDSSAQDNQNIRADDSSEEEKVASSLTKAIVEALRSPWKSQYDTIFSVSNDYHQFIILSFFYCVCPILISGGYEPMMLLPGANWLFGIDLALRFICVVMCMLLLLQYNLHSRAGKKAQSKYLYLGLFYLPIIAIYSFMISPQSQIAAVGLMFTLVSISLFVNWRACLIINIVALICAQALYSTVLHVTCLGCVDPSPMMKGSIIYITASIVLSVIMSFNNSMRIGQHDRNSKAISLETLQNNAKAKMEIDKAIEILNAAANVPADEVKYGDHLVVVGGRQVFIISDAECAIVHEALTSSYNELGRHSNNTSGGTHGTMHGKLSDYGEYSARRVLFLAISVARLSKDERERVMVEVKRDFTFYGSSSLVQSAIRHIITHAFVYKQPETKIQIIIDAPRIYIMYPSDTFIGAEGEGILGHNIWVSLGIDTSRGEMINMGGDLHYELLPEDMIRITITLPTALNQAEPG